MRLLSLLLPVVVAAACAPSKEEVEAEFNAFVSKHNTCAADDECALVSPGCPLGCEVAVNESSAEATIAKARELIDDYESGGAACDYECTGFSVAVCDEGRCTTAVEEPDVGGGCTAIGCGSAFAVAFSKESAWAPGPYRVFVTLDGDVVDCSASLPLACDAPFPCDDPGVLLLLEGCALDPSVHALGGIELPELAPSSVTVEVSRDGVSLASGEWSPEYETSRPNGPACEPECHTAPGETLSIP